MAHDKGSIVIFRSTERFRMSESMTEIARLLPPVLKLVYNCTQVMRETINMNSRITYIELRYKAF